MWNKIIHPKTGRKVNLNSKIGKQVLRNYVNQIGGAEQAGIEDEYADINEFGNINQALVQSIADDDIDNVIQILEYSRHNKVLEQQLLEIEGLKIYGTSKNKTSVISFNLEGIHPYDVGTLLDKMGIAVRTGHHCAQPIMNFYKIPGTIRASFAFYNTKAEIDALVGGVKKAKMMLS